MGRIGEILKSTNYGLEQFTHDEIQRLEDRIVERESNGKLQYRVKCLVREREIALKPEEIARQLYLDRLINVYLYPVERIILEYHIHFGRDVKRADIVVLDSEKKDIPYIVFEIKKPKLTDGKEQLKSYCNASGAPIGVWTNGKQISFYNRLDPNFFEPIPSLPKANETLRDVLTKRKTLDELKRDNKLVSEGKTLKDIIIEMEDEVLANSGVDSFEEVFKLIFTKVFDEIMSEQDNNRYLEFRNYDQGNEEEEKRLMILKGKINDLFQEAKEEWEGIFPIDSKIDLTATHLAVCISSLQDVNLVDSNLEVIDDAFEFLMNKQQKGDKGQYFTPRYVIDMVVRMLNPQQGESMIDVSAGSCGFPIHTIFSVWSKMISGANGVLDLLQLKKSRQFTDYAKNNIFAIDFDEKATRVSRTLNLMAVEGAANILKMNSLDYISWEHISADNDWRSIFQENWKRLLKYQSVKKTKSTDRENFRDFDFDIAMGNPPFAGDIKESKIITQYEGLGKKANGKYETKVSRDILFIERNFDLLKDGGRMALILPQGRFNNANDEYVRNYIASRGRILAVVGLHQNVFKPHTGTKTSIIFVQKWDDSLCPKVDDYPIFFATMCKPSKDNSGDKIYRIDESGKYVLDKSGHWIVDHDLFNVDGVTEDGIAEAFEEFAKKEKLSFF